VFCAPVLACLPTRIDAQNGYFLNLSHEFRLRRASAAVQPNRMPGMPGLPATARDLFRVSVTIGQCRLACAA
jgi:hypothetical protein